VKLFIVVCTVCREVLVRKVSTIGKSREFRYQKVRDSKPGLQILDRLDSGFVTHWKEIYCEEGRKHWIKSLHI
jgi:hypothetical protein